MSAGIIVSACMSNYSCSGLETGGFFSILLYPSTRLHNITPQKKTNIKTIHCSFH